MKNSKAQAKIMFIDAAPPRHAAAALVLGLLAVSLAAGCVTHPETEGVLAGGHLAQGPQTHNDTTDGGGIHDDNGTTWTELTSTTWRGDTFHTEVHVANGTASHQVTPTWCIHVSNLRGAGFRELYMLSELDGTDMSTPLWRLGLHHPWNDNETRNETATDTHRVSLAYHTPRPLAPNDTVGDALWIYVEPADELLGAAKDQWIRHTVEARAVYPSHLVFEVRWDAQCTTDEPPEDQAAAPSTDPRGPVPLQTTTTPATATRTGSATQSGAIGQPLCQGNSNTLHQCLHRHA